MQNILEDVKFYHLDDAESAGSSIDSDSAIIDTANFDGCVFICPITDSVATGVASLIVEQNTANSASGMAALSGATATATCTDNDDLNSQLLIVDIFRPRERYLRVNRTSATANIAFGDVIAILYHGRKSPITQETAEVAHAVSLQSPAEA